MGATLVPADSSIFKRGGVANRALCLVLTVALVATMTVLPMPAYAADVESGTPQLQASALLPNVTARSQEEIKAFLKSHPFNLYADTQFSEVPSMNAPFAPGKLSEKTLNEALNALNVMRYIAGLDSNVALDSSFNEKAQAAALVNAANGTLSHTPAKPTGMTDDLYKLGSSGCGSSNLSAGRLNPAATVLGYMDDSDSSNISRVGHRRWIINPSMSKTGFGMVLALQTRYGSWGALYAFDRANVSASQTNVVWPAQNMPIDYFDSSQAWSVSTGSEVRAENVEVLVTRIADDRKWSFSQENADGDFYVDNGNYGLKGCVIFRPSDMGDIEEGDKFRVQVTGISEELDYTVSFFRADPLSAYKRVEPQLIGSTFTYDGKGHNAVYFTAGYNVSGTHYAVNPGTYSYTLTLKEGYIWRDGTSEPKVFKWIIKAPASSSGSGSSSVSKPSSPSTSAKPGSTSTSKPSTTTKPSTTAKVKKPAATSLKSVKAGKKKATIKWKKQTKNVSGYQVWLSTSKKFNKNLIKKTVSKKKTSLTVKKLKAKKTYYVKIRTYYQNPTTKKKTYSNWSKVKRVTIKK